MTLSNIRLIYVDALIVAEVVNSEKTEKIEVVWCDEWKGDGNVRLTNSQNEALGERSYDVGRYFGRTTQTDLYGKLICVCRSSCRTPLLICRSFLLHTSLRRYQSS